MTLLALATICGIYVGLNRHVIVLVPLMLLLAFIHASTTSSQGLLGVLLDFGVQIIALQCGYMLGLTCRNLSGRPASLPSSGPGTKSGDHPEWI